MKLKTPYSTYEVELITSTYESNWRKYYWLYDKKDGEPVADITVNDPCEMLDNNEFLIDQDFLNFCFWWDSEKMRKRLKKNLKIKELRNGWFYRHFTI